MIQSNYLSIPNQELKINNWEQLPFKEKVPIDLYLYIFGKMRVQDLRILCLVNKSCRILADREIIWESICKEKFNPQICALKTTKETWKNFYKEKCLELEDKIVSINTVVPFNAIPRLANVFLRYLVAPKTEDLTVMWIPQKDEVSKYTLGYYATWIKVAQYCKTNELSFDQIKSCFANQVPIHQPLNKLLDDFVNQAQTGIAFIPADEKSNKLAAILTFMEKLTVLVPKIHGKFVLADQGKNDEYQKDLEEKIIPFFKKWPKANIYPKLPSIILNELK